jgi:hypothetical protein
MIFTAFEVYIKLVKRSSDNLQISQFTYLLSELISETDSSGGLGQYLTFIIPRILFVFNSTLGVADSRNTEFAIWCAKLASREVG